MTEIVSLASGFDLQRPRSGSPQTVFPLSGTFGAVRVAQKARTVDNALTGRVTRLFRSGARYRRQLERYGEKDYEGKINDWKIAILSVCFAKKLDGLR